MMRRRWMRGQSVVEYTLMLFVASVCFAVMFSLVRSALSERHKGGADGIGQGLLWP